MTELNEVIDKIGDKIADAKAGKKTPSPVKELAERRERTAAALRFSTTYEFTKVKTGVKPSVVLSDEKSVIAHTWASRKLINEVAALNAAVPFVKRFPLTNRDDTKYAVDIPIGVTIVIGKSGSGKTRFVLDHLFTTAQAQNLAPLYIKMHEPGDEAKLDALDRGENVAIPDFEVDMVDELAKGLFGVGRDLIIIDSLRYLFYSSSGGATGKGGVNMSIFMDLTHLDVLATRLRKRVVVVINPMTDDASAFDFYVEAADGAAASVIVTDSATSARVKNRYSSSREFVALAVPKQSVNDKTYVSSAANASGQKLATPRAGNVSVNSTIFGRHKLKDQNG